MTSSFLPVAIGNLPWYQENVKLKDGIFFTNSFTAYELANDHKHTNEIKVFKF